MEAALNLIADVFDIVHYHFQIIFAVMGGILAATWINIRP
jgi:uncharacterized membrane protein YagU involved in acid resistance